MLSSIRFGLYLYFAIVFVLLPGSNSTTNTISDTRLCADRSCETQISKARALARTKPLDPAFLAFERGDIINVFSKSAGSRQELWGGELNGKTGYFSRSFVREFNVIIPNPQHEVETEPHIPLEDRVRGEVPPARKSQEPPPPVQENVQPAQATEQTQNAGSDSPKEQPLEEKTVDDGTEIDETEIDGTEVAEEANTLPPHATEVPVEQENLPDVKTEEYVDPKQVDTDETEIGDETELADYEDEIALDGEPGQDTKPDDKQPEAGGGSGQVTENLVNISDDTELDGTEIDETEDPTEVADNDVQDDTEIGSQIDDPDVDSTEIIDGKQDTAEDAVKDGTEVEQDDTEVGSELDETEVDETEIGDETTTDDGNDKETEAQTADIQNDGDKIPEHLADDDTTKATIAEQIDETELAEEDAQGSLFGSMFSGQDGGKVSNMGDNSVDHMQHYDDNQHVTHSHIDKELPDTGIGSDSRHDRPFADDDTPYTENESHQYNAGAGNGHTEHFEDVQISMSHGDSKSNGQQDLPVATVPSNTDTVPSNIDTGEGNTENELDTNQQILDIGKSREHIESHPYERVEQYDTDNFGDGNIDSHTNKDILPPDADKLNSGVGLDQFIDDNFNEIIPSSNSIGVDNTYPTDTSTHSNTNLASDVDQNVKEIDESNSDTQQNHVGLQQEMQAIDAANLDDTNTLVKEQAEENTAEALEEEISDNHRDGAELATDDVLDIADHNGVNTGQNDEFQYEPHNDLDASNEYIDEGYESVDDKFEESLEAINEDIGLFDEESTVLPTDDSEAVDNLDAEYGNTDTQQHAGDGSSMDLHLFTNTGDESDDVTVAVTNIFDNVNPTMHGHVSSALSSITYHDETAQSSLLDMADPSILNADMAVHGASSNTLPSTKAEIYDVKLSTIVTDNILTDNSVLISATSTLTDSSSQMASMTYTASDSLAHIEPLVHNTDPLDRSSSNIDIQPTRSYTSPDVSTLGDIDADGERVKKSEVETSLQFDAQGDAQGNVVEVATAHHGNLLSNMLKEEINKDRKASIREATQDDNTIKDSTADIAMDNVNDIGDTRESGVVSEIREGKPNKASAPSNVPAFDVKLEPASLLDMAYKHEAAHITTSSNGNGVSGRLLDNDVRSQTDEKVVTMETDNKMDDVDKLKYLAVFGGSEEKKPDDGQQVADKQPIETPQEQLDNGGNEPETGATDQDNTDTSEDNKQDVTVATDDETEVLKSDEVVATREEAMDALGIPADRRQPADEGKGDLKFVDEHGQALENDVARGEADHNVHGANIEASKVDANVREMDMNDNTADVERNEELAMSTEIVDQVTTITDTLGDTTVLTDSNVEESTPALDILSTAVQDTVNIANTLITSEVAYSSYASSTTEQLHASLSDNAKQDTIIDGTTFFDFDAEPTPILESLQTPSLELVSSSLAESADTPSQQITVTSLFDPLEGTVSDTPQDTTHITESMQQDTAYITDTTQYEHTVQTTDTQWTTDLNIQASETLKEETVLETNTGHTEQVSVLGTSFGFATESLDDYNTLPIDTIQASMETEMLQHNETVESNNVQDQVQPSMDQEVYMTDVYLSRKPLSTDASTQGVQTQGQDETSHTNQQLDVNNNELQPQVDLNNNELKTGEAVTDSIPLQGSTTEQMPEYVDRPPTEIPGHEDPYSSDAMMSRKVPDPQLDEETKQAPLDILKMLEPLLKTLVEMLPGSFQSILEQEPLGLSPPLTLLVAIVTTKVMALLTCISCVCSGGKKKSTKADPLIIIRGLEEKLFIATKERENMEDDLQEKTQQVDELRDQVHSQQSTHGTVEVDLKTIKLHNDALKKQVSTLQQEVIDYKHEVSEKVQQLTYKDSEIQAYAGELTEVQQRAHDAEMATQMASQGVSERNEELTTAMVQVKTLSEQIQHLETRKQQLEDESMDWTERVKDLSEQVEQSSVETKRMQEDLAFKENELEVLRDCFLQVKAFQGDEEMKEEPEETPDLSEKLKQMMDVSRVNASLRAVEEERDVIQNKLVIEIESRKESEDQIQGLKRKMETNQTDKMKAERQCQEAQTKLEVLSKYFKEKEAELTRQLGEQEVLKNQNISKLESSDSFTQDLSKQNEIYRTQVEDLKTEISKAERDFRSQIAANEKKAHENWLATRAAERELKESRHECGMLRQKLTDLERKLLQGPPPGLIRPITHRGMPPPGLMNGPPPPPPPERPGSRGSVHGHVTPRLRDDDYRGSPGADRMAPPPDRRLPPGGPRPPPPHMGPTSPPPFGVRPPYPGERRSPPPFDRYPPPPMRGPRPLYPRPPPPPHLRSPPLGSSSEFDDSRQGLGSPSYSRQAPPPRNPDHGSTRQGSQV